MPKSPRPLRLFSRWLLLTSLLISIAGPLWAQNNSFIAINYHDIIAEEERVPPFDRVAVCQAHLEAHFAWLKKNGYSVISFGAVLEAARGGRPLPDKAVLLTFDDGYESFYSRVFPLLKRYHYPAVVALVGAWMSDPPAEPRPSGKTLLSWAQVRELSRSGLVEIASHSEALHHGVTANPSGNEQAAATTRIYDQDLRQYEDDEEYHQRIQAALTRSAQFIWQKAGIRPRLMVWPFGEYNAELLEAARQAGMPHTMALGDGLNTLADLSAMRRLLIADDPDEKQFAAIVRELRKDRPLRVIHLDMDYLHDPDPDQTERNLGAVIERVRASGANTVFLQAYSDPDGDGNADALYFPNRHLPVKADLFNRVAWQLKTRAGVKIYAWMPMMAFQADVPSEWRVLEWREGKAQTPTHIYSRISPFSPEGRAWVGDLFEDLSKFNAFDGLLFHDDGILSDYEDVSDEALRYSRDVWGLETRFETLHGTPANRLRWAQLKTQLMLQYTDYLTERARQFRPQLRTARNLYALPVLQQESEEWYAQSLKGFLAHYDVVALEAMPFMEEAKEPDEWLAKLAERVKAEPEGLKKTLFELQSVDWRTHKAVDSGVLQRQIGLLRKIGVQHLGYYPDDVFNDQPKLELLQQFFAVAVKP